MPTKQKVGRPRSSIWIKDGEANAIGRRLREKGFTRKELAIMLEIPAHSFYNWLKGVMGLSPERRAAVYAFLDQ